MPLIIPISELQNAVMSNELYDKTTRIKRIDQAIFESEKEMHEGGESIDLDDAIEILNKKYQGWI